MNLHHLPPPSFLHYVHGWSPLLKAQWTTWDNGASNPTLDKWYVLGYSENQLRLEFAGDADGTLPTTGVGLIRSKLSGGFGVSYEPEFSIQKEEFRLLYQFFRSTVELLRDANASNPVFQEFSGEHGGAMVLAKLQGIARARLVIFQRDEAFQRRFDVSDQALRSLEEMTRFFVNWINDPSSLSILASDSGLLRNQRQE